MFSSSHQITNITQICTHIDHIHILPNTLYFARLISYTSCYCGDRHCSVKSVCSCVYIECVTQICTHTDHIHILPITLYFCQACLIHLLLPWRQTLLYKKCVYIECVYACVFQRCVVCGEEVFILSINTSFL